MRIFITGDIHGYAADISLRMQEISNPTEDDVIIVCGDAGLEYGENIMGQAKKAMKKFPGKWIILRGNHDNRYWRNHKSSEGWYVENGYLYQKKYPNILYTRDSGGIYTIGKYNFLFIPGAYSVDGRYRLSKGLPFEKEEQLTDDEWNKLFSLDVSSVNFVIAHTLPYSLENKVKYLFLPFLDQALIDKTSEKNIDKIMKKIYNNSNFYQYFGGHYHDSKQLDDKHTMLYRAVVNVESYI